jgi:hypothetical protein
MYILVNILLKTLTYVLVLIITNEAQTLLRLDVYYGFICALIFYINIYKYIIIFSFIVFPNYRYQYCFNIYVISCVVSMFMLPRLLAA